MGLSLYTHLPCPQIYDSKTCRFLPRARGAPAQLLPGISTANFGTRSCLGIRYPGNGTMPHDRKTHLVRCKECFMGDPFVFRLGIERPQSATICHDSPGTLGRFTACFPTKDNFSRFPGVCLNMPYLKGYRYHVGYFAGSDIHL